MRVQVESRLALKLDAATSALGAATEAVVKSATALVYRTAVENCSGPGITPIHARHHPAAGKMPIPIRTGHLRQSIQMVVPERFLGIVRSDWTVAPYNRFVHDGTKYMRPRPFMRLAADKNRAEITRMFESVRDAVRRVGR